MNFLNHSFLVYYLNIKIQHIKIEKVFNYLIYVKVLYFLYMIFFVF